MRLAIIGTGAMARYYAKLFDILDPVMVGRHGGPFLLKNGEQKTLVTPRFLPWSDAHAFLFDVVILAVKWPAMPLVREFLQDAPQELLVISTMNGMGQEEALIPPLAPEQLMVGITTDAVTAYWDNQAQLPAARVSAVGQTILPLLPHPFLPLWQKQLQILNLTSSWKFLSAKMVLRERWIKLIANSVINPLTALANVPNGELPRLPLWSLSTALIHEATNVAKTIGLSIDDDLSSRILQLCQATATNKSSMLQDIEQRKVTEIDAINGYIVRIGHNHAIDVSTHQALVHLIHMLSQQK
ncbi:ketopantoate reductase family protein [Sulfobacillus thermosulfidooxidans]|uniref:ketopantoate reductase family protein n=1 Tax=Sulfobacillus thermosulfidooxidans TaxID=28034 RepID=UPI0003FE52BA|nr:ketopantoate reductase C-terminal domain-containing protein [Sulfobacillus thermosulfidooxidans]